jgi:HEAT repeat protein
VKIISTATIGLSVSLLIISPIIAQMTGTSYNESPTPFAVSLRAHGIDTSKQSLVAALSNRDPVVRSLAANQLVADHDYLDKPAIEKALAAETDNQTRVGIASALASIGDPVGTRQLESMCTNATLPIDVTVHAVQQLAMVQRSYPKLASAGRCAETVLVALEGASEEYQQRELVSILPVLVRGLPQSTTDRVAADAQNLLTANEPATRMSASDALAQMGATSSTPALRSAIQSEKDPGVRAWHQRNLDKLLKLSNSAATP